VADDKFLSVVGSVASIFNAGGRIFWGGFIGDVYSYQTAMCCVSALLTSFVLTLIAIREWSSKIAYLVWICGIFFTFSGTFALIPMVTAKLFGPKYFGLNFGIMFSAFALSAFCSSLLSKGLYDAIGYQGIFFFVAGCTFTGFLITVFLDVSLLRKERKLAKRARAATKPLAGLESTMPLMEAGGERPSSPSLS